MRARGPIVFALGVVLIAACSFPDVTYSTAPDAASDANTDGSVDAMGNDGPEASADGGEDATLDVSEDHVADVVSDYVFEAAPDASPCDLDGDGYAAATCAGGTDCCDTDSRAHPGQTGWFIAPDHCSSFDYNCDTVLEGEHVTNLNCANETVLNCNGAGFSGDPGCGGQGPYVTCMPMGLGCGASPPDYVTQGCH